MDILDDFPKEQRDLTKEQADEITQIMRDLQNKFISLNVYWENLGDFWKKHGLKNFTKGLRVSSFLRFAYNPFCNLVN